MTFKIMNFIVTAPKDGLKKLSCLQKIPNSEPPIYNLGFGDQNPYSGETDDIVVSNNEDRDIVLATVANTIVEFCNHYGNHYIYAKGSTTARTRLYQMGIAGLWDEISKDFDVYGLKDDAWQVFEPNTINYDAFLVKQK